MQYAAEYIGSNYGAFAADHEVLVEANLRCAEDFGMDQVSCISDPYRETAGFGAEIRFHENAVPECVAPPLAESRDLSAIAPPDPESSEHMRDRLEAIRLYRKRAADRYSILGWVEGPGALAADLRGLQEFYMDLLDDAEWSGELLDLVTETGIRFARAQVEAGADTIGIGDAMCSQISTEAHRELILPRQERLVDGVRAAGGRVRLHICGQTRHLWEGLKTLKVDILDCDSMVDLRSARERFGPRATLAGNLNPVSELRFGELEKIRRAVRRCFEEAGPPFMVAAGCEVPSGTPKANPEALCEEVGA